MIYDLRALVSLLPQILAGHSDQRRFSGATQVNLELLSGPFTPHIGDLHSIACFRNKKGGSGL
jgi:hypothetical protein